MKTMWNWLQNLPKPGCRFAAPLLTKHLYAPHTLTPTERARLDAHLLACAPCHAEANTVCAVETLLRKRGRAALPAVIPAADLWDRIEGRIIAEQSVRPRTIPMPLRPVLLFAPVLAAVIVAAVLMPRGDTNAPVAGMLAAKIAAPGSVAVETAAAPQEAMEDTAKYVAVVTAKAQAESSRVAMNAPLTLPRQAAKLRAVAAATKPVAPRPRPTEYDVVTMVPLVRDTRPEARIARAVPPPKRESMMVAQAAPLPTAPLADSDISQDAITFASAPAPTLAASPPATFTSKTIRIVDSSVGTGVPGAGIAETASPVTDTLIRQRQKRGLFGGYGATIAALRTGGDTAP